MAQSFFQVFSTPLLLDISSADSLHAPEAIVILYLALILLAAKIGAEFASRIGQPAVLGELLAGIVMGNLAFSGVTFLEPIKTEPVIGMLARLGVLILIFEVGLESTVEQLRRVGVSAVLVAVFGVIASFFMGWGLAALLLPQASVYVHAFIGASLTATSVGITARVLKDLGKSRTDEARVILGAAVVDDILGLVILAIAIQVVLAANSGTTVSYLIFGLIAAKALGFILAAIVLGMFLSKRIFRAASKLRSRDVLLSAGLIFCFLLAWMADLIGLAPLIGAFVAGLVLEEAHYSEFVQRGEPSLEHLVHPISSFLVPIFFVLMGMHFDLHVFAHPNFWLLAAGLITVAIAAKQACCFGVLTKGIDRTVIGIGMIPRGEVELIFADQGQKLQLHGAPLIDSAVFSAIVMTVIVTTVLTPPLLKWRFK